MIESALRTLEVESGGLSVLAAAIRDGLGKPFIAAVELMSAATDVVAGPGPGHRDRHGQVRPCRPQDRRHPRLHRHARLLRASGRSQPWRPRHDHAAEGRHHGAVVVGRDRRAQGPHRLLAPFPNRSRSPSPPTARARWPRAADVVLTLPQAREACPHNLAPTTSSLMQLALGDALAIALLESRGFTAIDFGKLHPAGRLGAMLKFVRDIMRTGDVLPLARLGTRMSEAHRGDDRRKVSAASASPIRADGWSASSPTAICAGTCVLTCSTPRRRSDDEKPEDDPFRSARERSATRC